MRKPWIITCLSLVYAIHLYLKFSHTPVPVFVSSYLADVLCLPLLLAIVRILIQKVQQNPHFHLSFPMIFLVFLMVSFLFEVFLPQLSLRYRADGYDILAYAFGGLCYYVFQEDI